MRLIVKKKQRQYEVWEGMNGMKKSQNRDSDRQSGSADEKLHTTQQQGEQFAINQMKHTLY